MCQINPGKVVKNTRHIEQNAMVYPVEEHWTMIVIPTIMICILNENIMYTSNFQLYPP